MGQPMTMAERAKWTRRGQVRTALKAKAAQRVKVSPWLKKRAPMVGRGAKPGHWQPGVIHPITKKAVGNTLMSARDKKLFRSDGTARKGVGSATVLGAYSLPGGRKTKRTAKKSTRRSAVRRTKKTRKTTRKTARRTRRYRVKASKGRKSYMRRYPKRTRKGARKTVRRTRRTAVRRYRVKASRGRKSYMRRYPKRTRKARKGTKARRYVYRKRGTYRVKGRHGRKGYTRRYPRRARKTAKRAVRKTRVTRRYRVKAARGRKSYMRRYPKRTRKVARKTRKVARRAGVRRYRVKASRGRKSYMRRYAKRTRKTARKAIKVRTARYRVRRGRKTYLRRYPRRYRGARKYRGMRKYARRYGRRGARRSAYVRVRVPAKRRGGKIVRKGYSYKRRAKIARNPYKRSRVRVHAYSYNRKRPHRKHVKVHGYRRSQWYPHRYEGRWISQAKAKSLGLLSKREMKALARRHPGMLANPGSALAALPSLDQLKGIGIMVGEGLVGFGGAVAVGQALAAVPQVAQYTGAWTPVLGNLAAGLGFWALCHFMPDNMKLQEAKPYVMVGVGLAAAVNALRNLITGGTVPQSVGQWIVPGYAAAPAAPAGTAGLGQIDIYEAALNGVSGIEEELEHELNRMGGLGGDGIFGDANDGIFSGLDGTGTPVREAFAGSMGEYFKAPMSGVNVQEAFSGGVGEYFKSPVGEYMETPMGLGGTSVKQAYAGMGEYFKAPMGAYVEEAFAGGMGFSPEQVGGGQALMPGFRAAVQKIVRDRIASGQPMDDAFYTKLGQAAASLARRKFDQASGQVQDIGVQQWKSPVTQASVPNFTSPITDPDMTPGQAEEIEDYEGKGEDEGIFTGGEDEGIF